MGVNRLQHSTPGVLPPGSRDDLERRRLVKNVSAKDTSLWEDIVLFFSGFGVMAYLGGRAKNNTDTKISGIIVSSLALSFFFFVLWNGWLRKMLCCCLYKKKVPETV